MKAQKRKKAAKSLKRGKALEKKRPLLTVPLTEVYVSGHSLSSGGSRPPSE